MDTGDVRLNRLDGLSIRYCFQCLEFTCIYMILVLCGQVFGILCLKQF